MKLNKPCGFSGRKATLNNDFFSIVVVYDSMSVVQTETSIDTTPISPTASKGGLTMAGPWSVINKLREVCVCVCGGGGGGGGGVVTPYVCFTLNNQILLGGFRRREGGGGGYGGLH